ncbi:hypothetical protein JNM05_11660 [bacterium]|nr:hypothetical protein [bacterium]
MIETIIFQNKSFLLRNIEIKELGNITIGTTILSDALFNDEFEFTSDEARLIDDDIYYYVEPNEIIQDELAIKELLRHIK